MGAINGYVAWAGYRPSVDDDNRLQTEAFYESVAKKTVILIHFVVLYIKKSCSISSDMTARCHGINYQRKSKT